jgi:hypothetical protein
MTKNINQNKPNISVKKPKIALKITVGGLWVCKLVGTVLCTLFGIIGSPHGRRSAFRRHPGEPELNQDAR